MKGKIAEFIFTFVGYCIITFIWNKWNITTREIVEMVVIGTFAGLGAALLMKRLTRLITHIVEWVVTAR